MEKLYPPVLTKKDFISRYYLNEFGNRSPTWQSLAEFLNSPKHLDRLYHLRNRVAGCPTHYNLTRPQVLNLWPAIAEPEGYYLSEMAPTEQTLIQGEVYRSERGLELFYSRERLPMRDALSSKCNPPKQICAIMACRILQHFMDANSWDWLQVLLDRYDGHTVEFSTFDGCWGTVPLYNTVWWEIRAY